MKWLLVTLGFVALAAPLAAAPEDISRLLERIRRDHDLPALAAAAVDEGELVALGATGRRNVKQPVAVTLDDKWQIGSCTKSMTASVAAMLVEEGKLRWTSTIAEIFTDLAPTMNEAWRGVRLEQLFVHRGGAPHETPEELLKEAGREVGSPTEQRFAFIKGLLAQEPEKPPGAEWIYSDSGYAIAGAMMERASAQSWEELLRHRLFEPLGMTSAGFGPPATPGEFDQPWGHRGEDTPYKPVAAGPDPEYPPALGPAATVHCSMADFAKYAAWHLAGARGEGSLLPARCLARLHTAPEDQEYAMGWAITNRRWAGGRVLMHNGTTSTFRATMWLAPGKNTAFLAAVNADSEEAEEACNEVIRILINRF